MAFALNGRGKQFQKERKTERQKNGKTERRKKERKAAPGTLNQL
jgi:hypothetical protein